MEEKQPINSFLGRLLSNSPFRNLNPKWIIILFIGISLMIVSQFYSKGKNNFSNSTEQTMATDTKIEENITQGEELTPAMKEQLNLEKQIAKEIQEIINSIAGVSDSEVVVKLNATEKKIYETDVSTGSKQTVETDKNNGKRNIEEDTNEKQVVIVNDGTKDVPLVIETEMPQVTGVLVVARGVEDIRIKANVSEAIVRVLDVPSHKVAVLAK